MATALTSVLAKRRLSVLSFTVKQTRWFLPGEAD
jgi:hypothetical protein